MCEGSVVVRRENKAKYISETYFLAQLLTKDTPSAAFMPTYLCFMGVEKKVAYTGRRPGPQESMGLVLCFLPPPLLSLKLFVGLPLSLQNQILLTDILYLISAYPCFFSHSKYSE